MKELKEEGRYTQIEMINLLKNNVFQKEWIDYQIRQLPKHEEYVIPTSLTDSNGK